MIPEKKEKSPSFISVIIPLLCIAFAFLYFYHTRDYLNFESVKFPYTIAVFLIFLFGIIEILEARKWWKHRKSEQKENASTPHKGLVVSATSKQWNPFYIVLLTVLFATFITTLNTIIGTYIYIIGLRLVLRKINLKTCIFDFVAITLIFLIMHEILLIQLPAGKAEQMLSLIVNKIF